jgi:hypothetical protein
MIASRFCDTRTVPESSKASAVATASRTVPLVDGIYRITIVPCGVNFGFKLRQIHAFSPHI